MRIRENLYKSLRTAAALSVEIALTCLFIGQKRVFESRKEDISNMCVLFPAHSGEKEERGPFLSLCSSRMKSSTDGKAISGMSCTGRGSRSLSLRRGFCNTHFSTRASLPLRAFAPSTLGLQLRGGNVIPFAQPSELPCAEMKRKVQAANKLFFS